MEITLKKGSPIGKRAHIIQLTFYDSSMPMKNSSATFGVRKLDSGGSEIYMEIETEPTNKLMQPMMYLMFRFKMIPGIIKGLDDFYKKDNLVSNLQLS